MSDLTWIKLYRKISEWEWANDKNTFCLFIHLLIRANYEESLFQGIKVGRGSVVFGYNAWSQKTGLSVSQARTSIARLSNSGMIAIKKTPKFSIISIINWDSYQQNSSNLNSESQENDNQNRSEIATSKEIKEIKEIKNKEKEPEIDPEEDPTKINLQKIALIWNNMAGQCGVPKTKLTKLVESRLKKRYHEARTAYPSVEDWQRIVEAVPYNDFYVGRTEHKFRATFEWLFQDHGKKKIPNYVCLMNDWDFYNGGNKND